MAVYKLNESSNKAKNHTKLSERYLQEGPGAGYTVEGEIDRVVSINSFKVVDKEYEGEYTPYDSDEPVEYYTIGIECDVDILLNNVSIESYYYGGLIESSIPAKLNYISLGGVDGNTKITKDMLDSAINCINSFEVSLGGGWTHSTFDGEISTEDIVEKHYHYNEFDSVGFIELQLTNQEDINYLDRACTGDDKVVSYDLFEDGELVDSFDDEDAAIEYAKEHCDSDDVEVIATEYIEDYHGDIEPTGYNDIVWQKD